MSPRASPEPLLDAARAAFILGPVSIHVAACGSDRRPSVTRAFGCNVAPDRRRIAVLVSEPRSRPVLEHLRATRAIAAVFNRPATHETIQLKGEDADIEALAPGDRAVMQAYGEAFVAELVALGYTESFARGVAGGVAEEAVAVWFSPSAAFVQTPGPGAGERLRG